MPPHLVYPFYDTEPAFYPGRLLLSSTCHDLSGAPFSFHWYAKLTFCQPIPGFVTTKCKLVLGRDTVWNFMCGFKSHKYFHTNFFIQMACVEKFVWNKTTRVIPHKLPDTIIVSQWLEERMPDRVKKGKDLPSDHIANTFGRTGFLLRRRAIRKSHLGSGTC
jgi:hypothetical protein